MGKFIRRTGTFKYYNITRFKGKNFKNNILLRYSLWLILTILFCYLTTLNRSYFTAVISVICIAKVYYYVKRMHRYYNAINNSYSLKSKIIIIKDIHKPLEFFIPCQPVEAIRHCNVRLRREFQTADNYYLFTIAGDKIIPVNQWNTSSSKPNPEHPAYNKLVYAVPIELLFELEVLFQNKMI